MQSFIVRSSPDERHVCVRVLKQNLAMVTRPGDHDRSPRSIQALPIRSALAVAECLAEQFGTDVSVVGRVTRQHLN